MTLQQIKDESTEEIMARITQKYKAIDAQHTEPPQDRKETKIIISNYQKATKKMQMGICSKLLKHRKRFDAFDFHVRVGSLPPKNEKTKDLPAIDTEPTIQNINERYLQIIGRKHEDLNTESREEENVIARHVIFHFLATRIYKGTNPEPKRTLRTTLKKVALLYNKDHSTACHSTKVVNQLLFSNPSFNSRYFDIETSLCKYFNIP